MTDEDIVQRLAKERGWDLLPNLSNRIRLRWKDHVIESISPWRPLGDENDAHECLKELITKAGRQVAFVAYLKYVAGDNDFDLITANPRQICEAIVMTLDNITPS